MKNSVTAVSDEDKIFYIDLPETIDYVGAGAFFPRLDGVNIKINGIPNSLKVLRSCSFLGCMFPKKIIIPNKVEIIEEDALPVFGENSVSLPKSLRELSLFNGASGGNYGNSFGKIIDINDNPNFRLIDGALYTADSSYVYLGTVGQHNKRLHITKNLKFDEDFFDRMDYSEIWFEKGIIDSISFDERNPYYSHYNHCIYTKQLDTLLYVLPTVDNVRLSARLKSVSGMRSGIHYEIPSGMSVEGMKACIDIFSNLNIEFKFNGKEYKNEESDSEKRLVNSDFFDLILKENINNPKLLCIKGLLYLEDDRFYQAYDLLDSIKGIGCLGSDPYMSLLDSCCIYKYRMDKYIEEYKSIDANNHDENVEICLKIRDYFNNTADYLNREVDIHNAFYVNWVLGAHESYSNKSYSLTYMEKGIPYALKLVNEFDTEKYRNEVSDFYASLAYVASYDGEKSKQFIQKSLELNPNNIDAYEALGAYIYYNGDEDKNAKIKDLIMEVEKIAPDYSKSKDHFLYQLLNNEGTHD